MLLKTRKRECGLRYFDCEECEEFMVCTLKRQKIIDHVLDHWLPQQTIYHYEKEPTEQELDLAKKLVRQAQLSNAVIPYIRIDIEGNISRYQTKIIKQKRI